MELTILRSVLLGKLRPWLDANKNVTFYNQNLTPQFIQPQNSIDEYYTLLKDIYNKDKDLFIKDGLQIYLSQPSNNVKQNINIPLVTMNESLQPTNPIERFYYALIKNEVTRISNNVLQAILKRIKDVDRKYIINTIKTNIVSFLKLIGDNQEIIKSKDEVSKNIINVLQSHTVRLLLEIELLYPHYLSSLQSDKYQIFGEYLKTDIPEDNFYSENSLIREISNLSTQVSKKIITKQLEIPNAFSFRFKGDETKLKFVINQLALYLDFIKEPTTEKHLLEVLTAKNLTENSPKIYLNCQTVVFKYFIDFIKVYFHNFNATQMEKSKLFYSKDHPEKPLKAQTIYSSISNDYDGKKEEINKYINHLK